MRFDPTGTHAALLRAIRTMITADPELAPWLDGSADTLPHLVIESFDCAPWASLSYTGHRHRLALRLSGAIAAVEAAHDRLEALLETAAPALPGHCLIDLAIGEAEGTIDLAGGMALTITLEALTIID
jgi:hypothetical protein